MEDKNIIKLIMEGELSAFEMVFKHYYKPLVAYGSTLLKSRDEAEDIVQQVFVTIWNKRQDLGKVELLKSYLYRAVYNACLNRIKQLNVRQEYAKEYTLNTTTSTEEISGHKELQNAIESAMAQLPEQCGVVFKMSRFEQLKYQEIADKLGISVKTVENQMGKALKLMRLMLKDYITLFILFITNYIDR